jgi:hypothetical protein
VVFNPGGINFGVVNQGQEPVKTINIECAGMIDWRIESVDVPAGAPLKVTLEIRLHAPPAGDQPGLASYL